MWLLILLSQLLFFFKNNRKVAFTSNLNIVYEILLFALFIHIWNFQLTHLSFFYEERHWLIELLILWSLLRSVSYCVVWILLFQFQTYLLALTVNFYPVVTFFTERLLVFKFISQLYFFLVKAHTKLFHVIKTLFSSI